MNVDHPLFSSNEHKVGMSVRAVIESINDLAPLVLDPHCKPLIAAEYMDLLRSFGLLQHVLFDLRNR